MAHIKLNAGALIGDKWCEKGEVVEVSDSEAKAHVTAGTGTLEESPAPDDKHKAHPPKH
jgi:hypothetical protein